MSPTRRQLFGLMAGGAMSLATQPTLASDPARGTRDAFMMLSALNWEVDTLVLDEKGERTGSGSLESFGGVTLGRTVDGEWWMSASDKPGRAERFFHIDFDDPGAVAFLEVFASLLTTPPSTGGYRYSDLKRQRS